MLQDKEISATTVASAAMWTIGGTLITIGLIADVMLIGLGLYASGIGGVLSVRQMLDEQTALVKNAFALGRDYERGQNRMHSV